jgi:uncharacterized DUF497 family protein
VQSLVERRAAIGFVSTRLITVIFAPLGAEAVSVVSMRPAAATERRVYEDKKAI